MLASLALLLPASAQAAQDPTRPPPGLTAPPSGAAPVVEAPLQVGAIFLAGKLSFAIVDDREVRVGDRLADGRVTGIDETGVWLRVNGATRLLRLLPAIKKPPAKP